MKKFKKFAAILTAIVLLGSTSGVAVNEDATTVRITLYEGILPNAPTECVASAVSASLLLTTRNPIGKRSVVAG